MKYLITFWEKEERPIKITEREYKAIADVINRSKFIAVRGELVAVGDIRRIKKIKEEPLMLPPKVEKPISQEQLQTLKNKFSSLFS